MTSLRELQFAVYPFINRASFRDGCSWSNEVTGSDDLPEHIQNLLDEFSTLAGGFPDSPASQLWPAIERISLDMGFLLHRVVSTWAMSENMDLNRVKVNFALSVNYTPLIEDATYLGEDISSKLRDAMVFHFPLDRPVIYRPAKALTDNEIARIIEVLGKLAEVPEELETLCSTCNGVGEVARDTELVDCAACDGTGDGD